MLELIFSVNDSNTNTIVINGKWCKFCSFWHPSNFHIWDIFYSRWKICVHRSETFDQSSTRKTSLNWIKQLVSLLT